MPKEKRDKVFVWPSWISKLVAGEDHCFWKYWFKCHYTYDKMPSDFNLAAWNIKHTSLLRSRVDALEKLGFKVFIEDQNSFKMNFIVTKAGDTIIDDKLWPEDAISMRFTISGKADIVAIGEEEDERISGKMHSIALVEDCKTGSCKTSDHVQVIIYMLFLPKAIEMYKGLKFNGCIVYKNGVPNADIPASAAQDESLKQAIWNAIKKIVGNEADCRKTPSQKECAWCDVPKAECDKRIG